MTAAIRRPAVAGYFYPAEAQALAGLIDESVGPRHGLSPAVGVLLPHGSIARTKSVLGRTLRDVIVPRRCILLGPSHTGTRMPWSILKEGAYRTPLGDVPVDTDAAEALMVRCPFLETDGWSQRGEHAIEVVLPWLQRLGPEALKIVPIIFSSEEASELSALARAVTQVVRLLEEPVLLIASTDTSHYVPEQQALEQDRVIFGALGALDSAALTAGLQEQKIVMCGWAAAAVLIEAAKALGAKQATLAAYTTSASAGGDPHSVIGYGGLIIR
jgi:AmmeMemoRadiSam system protein B